MQKPPSTCRMYVKRRKRDNGLEMGIFLVRILGAFDSRLPKVQPSLKALEQVLSGCEQWDLMSSSLASRDNRRGQKNERLF